MNIFALVAVFLISVFIIAPIACFLGYLLDGDK